jgi:hypothetical protein
VARVGPAPFRRNKGAGSSREIQASYLPRITHVPVHALIYQRRTHPSPNTPCTSRHLSKPGRHVVGIVMSSNSESICRHSDKSPRVAIPVHAVNLSTNPHHTDAIPRCPATHNPARCREDTRRTRIDPYFTLMLGVVITPRVAVSLFLLGKPCPSPAVRFSTAALSSRRFYQLCTPRTRPLPTSVTEPTST